MIREQVVRAGGARDGGGVAPEAVTKSLQKLLKDTDASIRLRMIDEPSLAEKLRERHAAAVRAERTEGSAKGFNGFADEAITQAAVHWLLGCVFVRFLEDNGWLDERSAKVAWIAGRGDRLSVARDRRTLFLRPDPSLTDRDYLLYVFAEVAKLPGVAGLFDPQHNPLYLLQPTAQGAIKILEFFQKTDPDSNELVHDFTDPAHGTRFLGDLYQNLSESARKRYALCQTPGFVVDFILDRTLTPALDAFGLERVRLIDPSCGSGHFLLSAFARLYHLWQNREPGTNPPALVQRTLDAVYGVDLNPFAAEITRFRLLIAALESSRITRLKDAPNFRFNVAAGDSLLHGSRMEGGGIERDLFKDRLQHFYDTEDAEELKRILGQQYHVVVGNPPYINVSDSVLREAYRARFETCHGQYQLGVPFTERFFDLALRSDPLDTNEAGYMGMIVSNAFMKRSFGKKFVEKYLSQRDLTHIIDTSGLNFPAYGTPTTILFTRNRSPLLGKPIRAVRGIVGIMSRDEDLEQSEVWSEIVHHIDEPEFEGKRISVADASRESFARHPWSIGGGGATELKERLDKGGFTTLSTVSSDIGVIGRSSGDEVFVASSQRFEAKGVSHELFSEQISGDCLKEWHVTRTESVLFPYSIKMPDPQQDAGFLQWLWPCRTTLGNRATFSQRTYFEEGRPWWAWHQLSPQRLITTMTIAYGEISTHNHFVLDRSGRVFNQTAPVVKLPAKATEDQHLGLLGLLNSSTACFWLKQMAHDKGGGGVGGGLASEPWEHFKCFTTTVVSQFPIPKERPLAVTRLIQAASDARRVLLPQSLCALALPNRVSFEAACEEASTLFTRMVSLQEDLDWLCYRLYGLIEEDLTADFTQIPEVKLGERAFEIVMAREIEAGELETTWFERHRSTPITELPSSWSEAYRKLVERRIAMIETNRDIKLIERPEYKRRWNLPTWKAMEAEALKNWLLDRMEANPIWKERALVSCARLRDALARDADWLSVAELYYGKSIEDMDRFVIDLTVSEAVPFLPVLRYSETGLRKREEWEQVWRLQREEDAGATVDIPVPPKYASKDFQNADYWRQRGGLDVPKERFILYEGLRRDADQTPVLGWAGWSHLEQAQALAAYYQKMRTEEGWEPERLKPLLAGLLDLSPWLKQWHDELDPETGLNLGTYFSDFAKKQCQELGFSVEDVQAWQPPAGAKTGRKKKSKHK